jgi:predicted DNA-binding transcriptional regulator AlpA
MATPTKHAQTVTAIDQRDCFIRLSEAARYLGHAIPTIYGWVNHGVNGHKIKTKRVGSVTCTKLRWLDEFVEATQPRESLDDETLDQQLIAARLK